MSSVASSESPYGTLSRLSDPILRFLSHANTTELVINEPGSAFVETDGEWREVVDDVFSKEAISRFVTAVDSFAKGNLQAGESALLSTTLPTGQRVQVVGAPAVQHFALAIRKPGAVKLTLHDYERAGAFAGLKTQALGEGDGDQCLLHGRVGGEGVQGVQRLLPLSAGLRRQLCRACVCLLSRTLRAHCCERSQRLCVRSRSRLRGRLLCNELLRERSILLLLLLRCSLEPVLARCTCCSTPTSATFQRVRAETRWPCPIKSCTGTRSARSQIRTPPLSCAVAMLRPSAE